MTNINSSHRLPQHNSPSVTEVNILQSQIIEFIKFKKKLHIKLIERTDVKFVLDILVI